jgi:hypothetical protein
VTFTVGLVGLASAAVPVVTTDRCPSLPAASLGDAIAAELPADAAALVVDLSCTAAGLAAVQVTREGHAPIARAVDLRDVPPELRSRLLALTVAEMLAGPAGAEVVASPPVPPPEPEPVVVPVTDPPLVVTPPVPAGPRVALGLGALLFARGAAVPVGSFQLGLGPWTVDAFGAAARATDPLGTLRVRVAGGGVAGELMRRGEPGATLALALHGAAGAAALDAVPVHPDVVAAPAWTPYLALGPRLEARLASDRLDAAFRLGVDGVVGPVAVVEDRTLARLSGIAALAELSLGVRP